MHPVHDRFIRQAIQIASKNIGSPFAALLVVRETEEMVAVGVNRSHDLPIWHAEMVAIHEYFALEDRLPWADLDLYTTAEPCPMCHSAILWCGVGRVIFGTSIATLTKLGWRQIDITAAEITHRSPDHKCIVIGGVMSNECDALYAHKSIRH